MTPEERNAAMIEAGLSVLLAFCPDSATGDVTDQRMVLKIFEAMSKVMRQAAFPSTLA